MATGFYGSNNQPGKMAVHVVVEGAGSCVFVFTILNMILESVKGNETAAAVSVVAAVALGILVYALGPLSGCHVNPAVTVAAIFGGAIIPLEGLMYMIAQTVGGIAAGYLLRWRTSSADLHKVYRSLVHGDLSVTGGDIFFWEALGTGILILGVLFAAVSDRVPKEVSGISVGGALFVGLKSTSNHAGAFLNPAVLTGTIFAFGMNHRWWEYVLAEMIGALVVAFVYNFVPSVPAPKAPRS